MIFKKAYLFIKRLFRLKETDVANKPREENNYYSELFKLDIPCECSDEQSNIFNYSSNGDLLYAQMPLSKEELEKIPEGHRVRPYYVAYKLKYGYIAYPCSSSNSYSEDSIKLYKINAYTYDLDKTSYVKLSTPVYLPKDKLLNYVASLSDYDNKQIHRRLYLHNECEYMSLYKDKPELYNPMSGDIIENKGLYLIISSTDNEYITLFVTNDKDTRFKYKAYINSCSQRYIVDTVDIVNIKKNSGNTKIVDIINNDELQYIKRAIDSKTNIYSKISDNCLFYINDMQYYCVKANKYNLSVYRVFNNMNDYSLNCVEIVIDNEKLYIDKSIKYTINSFDDIYGVRTLSNKYSALINDKTRKNNTTKQKQKYFTSYPIGTVFKDVDSKEEYVYLYSNRCFDYFIKVNEYLNFKVYPEYPIYELQKNSMIRNGEVTDDELVQILLDQSEFGNDENDILYNKLISLLNKTNALK